MLNRPIKAASAAQAKTSMASSIAVPNSPSGLESPNGIGGASAAPTSPLVGYAASAALVATAGMLAFVVDHIIDAPNLSLVFVLPVIVAAAAYGWGPALASAVLGVGVLDFFFIQPRYSFAVANPTDIWALALLLAVAAIVSTVAAQSRGRALAARRAAEQAEALHAVAHAVIKAESQDALMHAAANALGRIFEAPAVILTELEAVITPVATSRGASLSAADLEAAQWTLVNDKPTRGETYPFDRSEFDFWPIHMRNDSRLVLGVKITGGPDGRPAGPDRYVDLIAGYLAGAPAVGNGPNATPAKAS
jgi:K+-sensing histidine kinase KdpD